MLAVETDLTGLADRSRVRQSLENLFRDAVEHWGREVTATVDGVTDGFCVADGGQGILDQKRDEIFRAGYSTTGDGTGFGLATVEEVVEVHGREVRLSTARWAAPASRFRHRNRKLTEGSVRDTLR